MIEEVKWNFAGIDFVASAFRTLFEPLSKTLFIADCHFGKASHFRKNNIPLPLAAAIPDYANLYTVLAKYQPGICVFMGDLFHSSHNMEWEWLTQLRKDFLSIRFILIQGNHDILNNSQYQRDEFEILPQMLFQNSVLLTHEPANDKETFNICGHIHPGFRIHGKARENLSFPCFFLHQKLLILPSFGKLTGHIAMNKRMPGGKALCIANSQLFWAE